jgi:hypothetical protein
MVIYRCDVCGTDLTRNYVSERLRAKLGIVDVEVTVGIRGTWNSGEICRSCLAKVVAEGKEKK